MHVLRDVSMMTVVDGERDGGAKGEEDKQASEEDHVVVE